MDLGYNDINYAEYFNKVVKLTRVTKSNSKYSPDSVSKDEVDIKVRVSGGSNFYRNEENNVSVADLVYKTLDKVNKKDLINGQTVVFVKEITEFDGTLAYYKVYV